MAKNLGEKAESKMIKTAVETVLKNLIFSAHQIDCLFSGDLLNQCISTSFGIRDFEIPFSEFLVLVLLLLRD